MTDKAFGHDGLEWPQTMDGMAWAVEFNKRFPGVPVDDALGWFCNAIMRGYDTASQLSETKTRQFIGWLSADIPELHSVEVPILADSWDRFRAIENPTETVEVDDE